jgi:hypothetical protein
VAEVSDGLHIAMPLLAEPRATTWRSQACPICGADWIPRKASRLPCHARCLIANAELRKIPLVTIGDRAEATKIADSLGMTWVVFIALAVAAHQEDPQPVKKKTGRS